MPNACYEHYPSGFYPFYKRKNEVQGELCPWPQSLLAVGLGFVSNAHHLTMKIFYYMSPQSQVLFPLALCKSARKTRCPNFTLQVEAQPSSYTYHGSQIIFFFLLDQENGMNQSLKKLTEGILKGKSVMEDRNYSTTKPRTSSQGTEENGKSEAEGKNSCFISGSQCEDDETRGDLGHSSTFQSPFSSEREASRMVGHGITI